MTGDIAHVTRLARGWEVEQRLVSVLIRTRFVSILRQ